MTAPVTYGSIRPCLHVPEPTTRLSFVGGPRPFERLPLLLLGHAAIVFQPRTEAHLGAAAIEVLRVFDERRQVLDVALLVDHYLPPIRS